MTAVAPPSNPVAHPCTQGAVHTCNRVQQSPFDYLHQNRVQQGELPPVGSDGIEDR